jgi:hypothetical protein
MERDQLVYEEAAALWRALFDEPPPPRADGAMILDMITRNVTPARYERLRSPHLRPATITWPVSPPDRIASAG